MAEDVDRWKLGQEIHLQHFGPELNKEVTAHLGDLGSEFQHSAIEHAFGTVLARPAIDIKTRLICNVAALVALGAGNERALKLHIRGALYNGWTKEQIEELMLHMTIYAGYPAAWAGLAVAKKAFAEHDAALAAADQEG